MAKQIIKYKMNKDLLLLTPCPFGEKLRQNGITINVGSIFCTRGCKYHGKMMPRYEVECNHP